MRSMRLVLVAMSLIFVGISYRANAQEVHINLTREDGFASRRVQVFKKPGDKLSGVSGIESFDARANSFAIGKVTGESITVTVDDLDKIEFQQALLVLHPMAQSGPFEVTAQPGATLRYQVRPDALKFQQWDLILPASLSPTTISPSTNSSGPTAHHGGKLTTQKVVEAKKLTWDPTSKSFVLEAQEVVYSREDWGGSGPSGTRK